MAVTATRPVTQETWPDFVRLFTTRGAPHYCFCTLYRLDYLVDGHEHSASEQRRDAMAALVARDIPIGVLAYEADEPVGWCSIAPRETYGRLARSRSMPRATPPETPTWTILCFFVPRSRRREGITLVLIDAAIAYAREKGAAVVEAYPFDTAGISSTHRGRSAAFAAAGFTQEGRRWWRSV